MATYPKKLKTLNVHLMLDSEVVTIADTTADDMATRALNEFKKYDTMHYETVEGGVKATNAIPYHAVQYIEVIEEDSEKIKFDPYGCETVEVYTLVLKNSPTSESGERILITVGETKHVPAPNGNRCFGWCNGRDGDYADWDNSTIKIVPPYNFTLTDEIAEEYADTKEIEVYSFCQ